MDERLIIPEIPEPDATANQQKPTKDVPSGKGLELDERLVASSQTPEDIDKALAELRPNSDTVSGDKS